MSSHERERRKIQKRKRSPSSSPRRKSNTSNDSYKSRQERRLRDRGRSNEHKRGEKRRSRSRSREREGNRRETSDERRGRGRSRSWDRGKRGDEFRGRGEEEEQGFGTKDDENTDSESNENMDKPDYSLSGKLTADTNTYKGVVIKYNEPPEARIPKRRWRLYPFKGDQSLDVLYIHRQSAYLVGRERKIADIPLLHPSISKQHAVLQYRLVNHEREDGVVVKRVKPYVIDLESTNGTYVNNNRVEASRYIELMEKDMIKFGFSTREYILLHEHSRESEDDEDEEAT